MSGNCHNYLFQTSWISKKYRNGDKVYGNLDKEIGYLLRKKEKPFLGYDIKQIKIQFNPRNKKCKLFS